jgi:membrane protein
VAVSLVLNLGLFWLAFRLATARSIAARDLRLGAFTAAVAWTILQLVGGYVIAHALHRSSELYGTFGLVLGLIAWLYLQAQITMYAVEMNVTAVRRLWPRSLFPPPYTRQDLEAYQMYAQSEQRRPDFTVELRQPGQDGASLAARRRAGPDGQHRAEDGHDPVKDDQKDPAPGG